MKSAQRTMDVLELLARHDAPLEAAMIARMCEIPRSSTYHLLNALLARGFVEQLGDHRWAIGGRLREIGLSAPSIHDTVAVLEAFVDDGERIDAGELARRTGLPIARTRQAVALLLREALLVEHDDGAVSLGLRLALLSARFGVVERLRAAAHPALLALRDRTGETANLLLVDGDELVYLEQAESRHALRHASWVGRRIPLAASASGKALALGRGPVVVHDAIEPGVTAVACGLAGLHGHQAAISVTGPTVRLRGPQLHEAERAVVLAARGVGARLRAND